MLNKADLDLILKRLDTLFGFMYDNKKTYDHIETEDINDIVEYFQNGQLSIFDLTEEQEKKGVL